MKGKKIILLLLTALVALLTACAAETAGPEATEEESTFHRVTFYGYYADEDPLTFKRIRSGGTVRLIPQFDWILGWMDSEGNFVDPDGVTVTEDMDFYAYSLPELVKGHVKYMGDIASVWFRPDTALRREEAAQILYSIVDWPEQEAEESPLPKPETEEESETEPAVEDGDADTGEEPVIYATIYDPQYPDLDETCPYYAAVKTVISWHLMSGYADGTFRPDQTITRAEFISMLQPFMKKTGNPVLHLPFDVPADYWAAQAIADAKASGLLDGFDDSLFYPERSITRAEAVVIVNALLGHVADAAALDYTAPADMYVDVPSDHWAYYDILDATYSDEFLSYIRGEMPGMEPGFLYINDRLCHVNEDLQLDYYEAGFHTIDGQLRFCSEAGYTIDEFSQGLHEINGSMYYCRSNGAFATDYTYKYLHFGPDGRYTSGDAALDALVEEFMSGILDNSSLSREEKLRAVYNRMLDRFGYINWGDGYYAGTTSWANKCAKIMFQRKSGHCFYWAGSFMLCARRLGYQAYVVCGYAGTVHSLHAWTMIDWPDGNEYIFDPGLEWSYVRGFIDGYAQDRDLFKQPFYATDTLYTFRDGSHTTQR